MSPARTAASPPTCRRFPARRRTSATAPAARRRRRRTSAPSRAPAGTSSPRRSRRKKIGVRNDAAASTNRRGGLESVRGAGAMAEVGKMKRLLAAVGAIAAICAAAAVPAQAKETITKFEVTPSTTQSGGHPDFETRFGFGNHGTGNPGEAAQDVRVHLPQGLFGNPNAVSKCPSDDFALAQCPTDAQVGVVVVRANYGGDDQNLLGAAPLYNMDSRSEDETARFAFIAPVANIPINIPIRVRTESDYGLTMTVTGIPQVIPLAEAHIRVWGFPASADNDSERFLKGSLAKPAGCPGEASGTCASNAGSNSHQSTLQLDPLTINPTTCTSEPLKV